VLVFDDASPRREELRLPLFAADDFERQWLSSQPLAPREVLQELEQLGQDVRRRRFWVPLRFDDGSEALAPVEELHVTPANHRVFQ
jgi:hypothetical protein